ALTAEPGDRYNDVWEDLSLGHGTVKIFPQEPMAPGDAFYLGFDRSVAGNVVRLDIEASVEGIGVMPDRPPLVWEAWQGEGWVPAPIPESALGRRSDTTGGLNRNGDLVLLIPRE